MALEYRTYMSYILYNSSRCTVKTLARPSSKIPSQPMPTPLAWLGLNIRKNRRTLGLTQEELATKASVSARRLRDIENVVPDSNPRLSTLTAVATALGVDVASLFKHRSLADFPNV